MGSERIERELAGGLRLVAEDALGIAAAHKKCLACHCYREMTEETVGALELWSAHAGSMNGACTDTGSIDALAQATVRLRDLLDSSEGTHG